MDGDTDERVARTLAPIFLALVLGAAVLLFWRTAFYSGGLFGSGEMRRGPVDIAELQADARALPPPPAVSRGGAASRRAPANDERLLDAPRSTLVAVAGVPGGVRRGGAGVAYGGVRSALEASSRARAAGTASASEESAGGSAGRRTLGGDASTGADSGGVTGRERGGAFGVMPGVSVAQLKLSGERGRVGGASIGGTGRGPSAASPAYSAVKERTAQALGARWSQYVKNDPGYLGPVFTETARKEWKSFMMESGIGSTAEYVSKAELEDERLREEVAKVDRIRGEIDGLAADVKRGIDQLTPLRKEAREKAVSGDRRGCRAIQSSAAGIFGNYKAECQTAHKLYAGCAVQGDATTEYFRRAGWESARAAETELCEKAHAEAFDLCQQVADANQNVQSLHCARPESE